MGKVTELKKLEDSEVELIGEISTAEFMAHWPEVLTDFKKNVKVDGFRPGHAPDQLIIEKVGEPAILTEMAEKALGRIYPDLIKEHSLDPIGGPAVTLTKLAKDNPLGFTLRVAVMPAITLPDHRPIAQKVVKDHPLPTEVSDEELTRTIDNIRRSRSKAPDNAANTPTPAEPELPELSDEFVKTLGDFSSLEDFKTKLRENLLAEKIAAARDKRRLLIIQTLGEEAKIPLPPVLVKHESEKMLEEMRGQIEQMGLSFADYLTHLKKTEDELKAGWTEDAKKRVMFGLVVNNLATAHKLTPTEDDIKKEMDTLMARLPDTAGKTSPERLRGYVQNVLTNHLVMKLIDSADTEQ